MLQKWTALEGWIAPTNDNQAEVPAELTPVNQNTYRTYPNGTPIWRGLIAWRAFIS